MEENGGKWGDLREKWGGTPSFQSPISPIFRGVRQLVQMVVIWMVLTTTSDVGNVAQGQGLPHHRVLHIDDAQHAQAFCHWFFRFLGVNASTL